MSALLVPAVAAQPVLEGGRRFTVELTGEAEVNPAGDPNQGDLDGTGTAVVVVNVGQQRVCWDITVDGIATPTAAHIHKAPPTSPGPIVVSFFHFGEPLDLEGCTTQPQDRDLLRDIVQNPQSYYVNVHNADFPAGALRGQLSRRP